MLGTACSRLQTALTFTAQLESYLMSKSDHHPELLADLPSFSLALAKKPPTEQATQQRQANVRPPFKQHGWALALMALLHTLYCCVLAPINAWELSLALAQTPISSTSQLAVLLGYSLFGLPLILLGVCLQRLQQQPQFQHSTTATIIAASLVLLSLIAILVQPYSVFWLGLILALHMLFTSLGKN